MCSDEMGTTVYCKFQCFAEKCGIYSILLPHTMHRAIIKHKFSVKSMNEYIPHRLKFSRVKIFEDFCLTLKQI